jgi:hypothetical protein
MKFKAILRLCIESSVMSFYFPAPKPASVLYLSPILSPEK